MKKYTLTLLIVVFAIQILIPLCSIWGRYDVLMSGEEVKIKVAPIDPYDAFRGRYVALGYDYELRYSQRKGKYGVLEVGDDGFADVVYVTDIKPEGEIYLVSNDDDYFDMPLDRYYMEEKLAPRAEQELSGAYITVRIKGDKSVISGLYIDGVRAEDLLTKDDDI